MPLSSPLLKRKTYVSWLKKCVLFGWFDSPETIHIKPVWRNESRALAAVRGERWKRNGIGSRRMSDWQQESRVHERVPILVIYEHTIFELWRWAFLCFENFFEWNFCWMPTKKTHIWSLCRRIISSDSQLVAEVWIYRCLEPCTNQEPYPKHENFKKWNPFHPTKTTRLGYSRARVRQALPRGSFVKGSKGAALIVEFPSLGDSSLATWFPQGKWMESTHTAWCLAWCGGSGVT